MNREIKFRAWDKENKRMFIPAGIYWNDIASAYFHKPDDEKYIYLNAKHLNENDYNIMQYTGLKDKNGKEIYEGDIVEWESDQEFLYEIIWSKNKGAWRMYHKKANKRSSTRYSPIGKQKNLEVIGNIHENKELLND